MLTPENNLSPEQIPQGVKVKIALQIIFIYHWKPVTTPSVHEKGEHEHNGQQTSSPQSKLTRPLARVSQEHE